MGLDMFLHAQKVVSGSTSKPERVAEFERLVEMLGVRKNIDREWPSGRVQFTVAYWRKANQIHRWFVHNCQNDRDECQEAYVSREQLHDLRDLCNRVLALPRVGSVLTPEAVRNAEELLPTQAGEMFGGTGYDDRYLLHVKSTIEKIDHALTLPDPWTFCYESDW